MPKHRLTLMFTLFFPLLVACSGTPVAGDNESLSDKWRIEVSEGAKSTGNMLFRITPKHGKPIDVDVGITEGARETVRASL